MAQQALSIAARHPRPPTFAGTPTSWRVLCDLYPAAQSPEIIQAVIDYCAVRHLDPMKKPVHIVPIYNSRLRRKVQTVMQGINEIEVTASRTGKWAGMDPAKWGPTVQRTFRGQREDDDGKTTAVEFTMSFPEWCSVTVWKLVGAERWAFTETLWWEEAYGRAGFRSEVPNARWQIAPRQMLHKCTKAAVLRATFPEEGVGYAAEEMDGHEVDDGGVTIDGTAEHKADTYGNTVETQGGDRPTTNGEAAKPPATNGSSTAGGEVVEDRTTIDFQLRNAPDPADWLRVFVRLCRAVTSLDELGQITGHFAVREALDKAPSLIRAQMNDELRQAHARLAEPPEDATAAGAGAENPPAPESGPPGGAASSPPAAAVNPVAPGVDPTIELLAEVETMDLARLNSLSTDREWRFRTMNLFPTDEDRVAEAIGNRRSKLTPKEPQP
jgi:phage recombination protein Bet